MIQIVQMGSFMNVDVGSILIYQDPYGIMEEF